MATEAPNTKAFTNLPPPLRESLPQELYKRYKQIRLDIASDEEKQDLQTSKKSADASFQETWSQLPPHLQESTRAQADDIPRKLSLLGYRIYNKQETDPTSKFEDGSVLEEFTGEQLDYLGRVEHDRWVSERQKSGWQSSSSGVRETGAENKKTPFFVAYEDLEQKWKDVDKAMVACVPEILKKEGYVIRKVQGQDED